MNIPCDCKTIAFIIALALLLVILFGTLLHRVNNKKDKDCDCD